MGEPVDSYLTFEPNGPSEMSIQSCGDLLPQDGSGTEAG